MNKVYIAFGSNIGDRYQVVEEALRSLNLNGLKVIKKSNIYETEPYGFQEQPPFINGALLAETEMNCRETLETLLRIELELGRVRLFKWGPRNIDLDIIFFNDEIYNEEDLKVPHPDMQNREFVLKPLYDICPGYIHPVFKVSVQELLKALENKVIDNTKEC